MKNRDSFMLDARSVEWHQYYLGDSPLRNDISWRTWRSVLQQHLTPQQLAAKACAVCNAPITSQKLFVSDYLGGYHLLCCARPCQTLTEQSAQRAIEDVENDSN